jgi:hypothetical protein
MSLPKPFKANIVPINSLRAQSIRKEWAEVSKVLDKNTFEWETVPEGLVWGDEQTQQQY